MYKEKDLVRVAKRENNTKRKYLVINALQGKHIPAEPRETIAMFDALAREVAPAYEGKKVLVVGFAETATAIGARLAIQLDSLYMQTTREDVKDVEYLYFTESHSHATEQKLINTDLDQIIQEIDVILFVEDEVTTGNTIMKIIEIIERTYEKTVEFGVASLLNGMDKASEEIYEKKRILRHYLVKTSHEKYTEIADSYRGDGEYIEVQSQKKDIDFVMKNMTNYKNGRRLLQGKDYLNSCERLWGQIRSMEKISPKEKILVVGTEEFMYPAIHVAYRLSGLGCFVRTHSTTRSPIVVSQEAVYPLHKRYALRSLYDCQRKTFIYDIDKYDRVLLLTDAMSPTKEGLTDLYQVLIENGNDKIQIIRWCD